MAYIVKMPKLGMKMNQGTLLEWFVAPGENVTEGTPIAEVESEKNNAEIAASEDGTLRQIYVSEGEAVGPGTPMGIIAAPDESIDDLESEIEFDPVASAGIVDPSTGGAKDAGASEDAGGEPDDTDRVRASPRAKRRAAELDVELEDVSGSGPEGAITVEDVEAASGSPEPTDSAEPVGSEDPSQSVRATPKAKKLARDLDIDLASIDGSGPKGAITAEDVEAAVQDGSSGSPSGEVATSSQISDERAPAEERELSSMRQTIADRLGKSYREAVHVTVSREIAVEEALAATDVVDDYIDPDASITDVLLVVLSATLEEHPEFNAAFEDGVHRIHEEQNVGIAVDVDGGLLTPVLDDLGNRTLDGLVQERREMTDRALSGEHAPEDLSGGTFTVTNLGMFGVDSFTPIINPPEVAILGVSSIRERPVRTDDGVGFQRVGGFDLAFDHRVVDGADAARFLDTFETHLTEPWPLLLDRA